MNDLTTIILLSTAVLVVFSLAYILVLIYTNKKIIEEQKLRIVEVDNERRKYKNLFENSLVGMIRFDFSSFEILDANPTVCDIFNVETIEELQRQMLLFPLDSIQKIRDELYAKKIISEYEIFLKDNGWILFSAKQESATIAQGVIIDITERKEYKNKIETQAQLLDETHDAIIVIDDRANIVYWNDAAETTYLWKKEKAFYKNLKTIIFSPDRYTYFDNAWDEVMRFGEWFGEYFNVTQDGRNLLIESHWKRIEGKDINQTYILIVNSDITEKRQIEQYTIRAQKMESIALLSGSIAHDLQNILSPVSFSIGLLKEDLSNPQNQKLLDAVDRIVNDGLSLVKKILTFGKGIKGERSILDLSMLLENSIDNFTAANTKKIHIEKDIDGAKYFIKGDGDQVKQVFLNMLANARDAVAERGNVAVSLTQAANNPELMKVYTEQEIENFVEIIISDNGSGIMEEDIPKIFDPFFTTKNEGYGTGIGLSIVQNIIKLHGGVITVESKYTMGTTFHIYLPIYLKGEV